jgi:uncharacterized surface protein with fasciclin (FAS1) repeats
MKGGIPAEEKTMKKFAILSVAALALSVSAFAKAPQEKDIVDTAVSAGKFTTLVKLVQAAGLVDTLKSAGPFTVLAPTDAAFAKLPKALVEKIVGDKKLLTSILTYHVISGKVLSTDLKNGMKAKTVQGEEVKVNLKKGVKFNKSTVVIADVMATNGVIHAIDTVLLPPSVAKALATKKKHH